MTVDVECPKCEHTFEDDPCFADGGIERIDAECPKCELGFIYDIEFEPVAINEREMPKCEFRNHEYIDDEKQYSQSCVRSTCIHCGNGKHTWIEAKPND